MGKTKWTLDAAHSEVSFKVKHMMITNVTGLLTDYTVEATSDSDDFVNADVTFSGKLSSINTGNEQRDAHLRSADFFDVDQNKEATFKSTKIEKTGSDLKLHGNLTIKGITKPIVLDVEFGGINKDPWGNTKAGFTVSGKLNRKDFGLNWNAALETGGVLVSDDVKIGAEIQLVKGA
jgi:polyisoprenoid-binding protein YceI